MKQTQPAATNTSCFGKCLSKPFQISVDRDVRWRDCHGVHRCIRTCENLWFVVSYDSIPGIPGGSERVRKGYRCRVLRVHRVHRKLEVIGILGAAEGFRRESVAASPIKAE